MSNFDSYLSNTSVSAEMPVKTEWSIFQQAVLYFLSILLIWVGFNTNTDRVVREWKLSNCIGNRMYVLEIYSQKSYQQYEFKNINAQSMLNFIKR